jgi:hypothetical protein
VPGVRVAAEKVATPLASRVCWPRTVEPSKKTTTPEGTPVVAVTVAVKVIFVPSVAGEAEEVSAVVVMAGAAAGVMVRVPGVLVMV